LRAQLVVTALDSLDLFYAEVGFSKPLAGQDRRLALVRAFRKLGLHRKQAQ
jgi:hypothetical protein